MLLDHFIHSAWWGINHHRIIRLDMRIVHTNARNDDEAAMLWVT